MTKKEARRILGITKDASRIDIEKRYAVLLKKRRMEIIREKSEMQNQDLPENENSMDRSADTYMAGETVADANTSEYDFDLITEAYNVLMGLEVKEREETPGKTDLLLKQVGVDKKKAKNFFYYYKFHILVAIILIFAVAYFVNDFANRVNPDFNTAFIGRIVYYDAVDALKDDIKAEISIIKEPGIDGAFMDDGLSGEQLYASDIKVSILFAAADIDVFIVDRENYERFAKQGLFMDLDEIVPKLGADVTENRDLMLVAEEYDGTGDNEYYEGAGDADNDMEQSAKEDSTEHIDNTGEGTLKDTSAELPEDAHLYGIDVSNSTALREAGVVAEDMIAAISLGCEQEEKAEAFLEYLLK